MTMQGESSEMPAFSDSEMRLAEGLEAALETPSSSENADSDVQSSDAHALIKVAIPLSQEEISELERILMHRFRHKLHLEVEIDPSVLGGVWVRVGDIVIDGSVRGKLEALRHYLRTQSRVISAANRRYSHPGADHV